jgi:hypothetical protein
MKVNIKECPNCAMRHEDIQLHSVHVRKGFTHWALCLVSLQKIDVWILADAKEPASILHMGGKNV